MGILIPEARRVAAWLFDLDGVLTDTATLHDRAWKIVFDEFLASLEPPGRPFDATEDYQRFVDGKPHADGVRAFLASRAIVLPEGSQSDPPGSPTIAGIARAKDSIYLDLLDSEGVRVFPDAIEVLESVRSAGCMSAVVTASEHCTEVLVAGGLDKRFDAQVDGVVAKRHGLHGKPAPDTYLFAASLLGTDPSRAAVVEDAIAGVQAGRAGAFALVIGVARRKAATELSNAGAGLVVADLGELIQGATTDRNGRDR